MTIINTSRGLSTLLQFLTVLFAFWSGRMKVHFIVFRKLEIYFVISGIYWLCVWEGKTRFQSGFKNPNCISLPSACFCNLTQKGFNSLFRACWKFEVADWGYVARFYQKAPGQSFNFLQLRSQHLRKRTFKWWYWPQWGCGSVESMSQLCFPRLSIWQAALLASSLNAKWSGTFEKIILLPKAWLFLHGIYK